MIREDFEKGLADTALARMSHSLSLESEASSTPEGQPDNTQVASLVPVGMGRKVLKELFGSDRAKLYGRSSRDLVQNRPKPVEAPGIEEVSETLGRYQRDKDPTQVPMATEPQSLMDIESPDQLAKLVEEAGKVVVPNKRNWKEVKARTDTVSKVMAELRPIAEGRQGGTLSDVQLTGVARIIATAYDDVAKIMVKIQAGTETPEDILKMANAKDTYEVMSGYLKGQGSEIGRALNSLKMTGAALKGKDLEAYEKMTSGEAGTRFTKYIKEWSDAVSRRIEKGDSMGKALAFVNEALRGDAIRMAVEFWKNNQLSGLKTHVVNNASVGAHLMYETMVVRPLASGIGAIRTGGAADVNRIRGDELMAPIYSAYAGLRGWMGLFWDNISSGKQQFDAMDKVEDSLALSNKIKESDAPKSIKTAADWATSASFKLLTATDEANRGIAFTQELYGLASRQASKEGKSGKAHVVRMNELLDEPPVEIYEKAMEHAAQMTFTDVEKKGWIASTSKALRTMIGEIPPLQFIIPYVNTPSRLLHVATEMSPLAPLSKRLREDIAEGGIKADIAMAKIVGGMGMGILYWQLYEAGIMTGTGPEDYTAQSMLKAEGWQPMAIKIDGKMYGMERMDPFSKSAKFTEALGSFLGEMDKAKYAANPADKEAAFARGMLHMVDAMMEDQWLEQASGFIKVLEGSESFDKYIARTGAGFIPYHAALKSIEEFKQKGRPQLTQDTIISDIGSMMEDQIRGNMPNFGMDPHFVRIKRNWDGSPHMPEQTQFAAVASPWGPTKLNGDSVTKLLFENGVFPSEPGSRLTLGGKSFSLQQLDESGRLYDRYIQLVGEERRTILKEIIADGDVDEARAEFGDGPESAVTRVLNKAMSGGKAAGTEKFFEELYRFVKDHPEIANSLNKAMGIDFEAVLEESVMGKDPFELKGSVVTEPARRPLEFPIPEMK